MKRFIIFGSACLSVAVAIYFGGFYDLSNPTTRLRYWTIAGTQETPTLIYITPPKFDEKAELIIPEVVATSANEDTLYLGNKWALAHLYDRFQKPAVIHRDVAGAWTNTDKKENADLSPEYYEWKRKHELEERQQMKGQINGKK